MHFLIIGGGSIGEPPLRNFLRIDGIACSIAEIQDDLRNRIASSYCIQQAFRDYRYADLPAYNAIVICVPTNLSCPDCDRCSGSRDARPEREASRHVTRPGRRTEALA